MSPDRADLLARVLSFDIDGGEVTLPFAARLARENGWSRSFADRAIEEYKRFVFLAVTGDSPVCPSEVVDAVWHLHLTYTRSYWKRLCGEVLDRPLHHDPTKGGAAEGEKHFAMYARTLSAYRIVFNQSPPADIWPSAVKRFGDDMKHRSVNTAHNWVIPKAPVKRITQLVAVFVLLGLFVPGCNGGFNPFVLKNRDFLWVLALSLVAAMCIGRVIRSVLRIPNPLPGDDVIELDWEQTAYMAGGASRLVTATIARLVGRGLAVVRNDKTLTPSGTSAEDVSAVELAVLRSLPITNELTALKPVQDAVEAAFASRIAQLEKDGLIIPQIRQAGIVLASLVPILLVLLCLALPRLIMGLLEHHPVEYLVITSVVGGLIAGFFARLGSLRLSNCGVAVLAQQKERHETLRTGTFWEHGGEAGMAVALFGTTVLAGTVIAPLQTWYPRQTSDSSSGGCSTGCGSGCGGGDGGGCGGGCGGGD